MHKRFVFNIVSRIIMIVCLIMLVPLGWAIADDVHSREVIAFIETILGGLVLASIALFFFRVNKKVKVSAKDGLAIVGLSWIFLSLLGAMPLYLSGVVPNFTNAFFEIVSGFTTTGATIFSDVEVLPRGILFWRSLTHWLGGMGIIVLYVALLPALGISAFQLYKAEAPGLNIERADPKVKETAKHLWSVYFILSLLSVGFLMFGGMDVFDALCHTFATMATGGFSTKNASMAAFSPFIQWVTIGFMFLAGVNFALHFQAFRGKLNVYFKNEEFIVYLCATFGLISVFTVILNMTDITLAPLRDSVFQVVAILTTTGYSTVDFDTWPNTLRFLLLLMMFVGGCGGSTAGGMKIVRMFLAVKISFRSIFQAVLPNAIMPVRINDRMINEKTTTGVLTYFSIFIFLFFIGSILFLAFEGCSLETAISATISALGNIGPGLDQVGATKNFGWVSPPGKWLLIFLMLAGRLELYSFLILFIPSTWRK
jgi:trk system potassium uptake protein TrkH